MVAKSAIILLTYSWLECIAEKNIASKRAGDIIWKWQGYSMICRVYATLCTNFKSVFTTPISVPLREYYRCFLDLYSEYFLRLLIFGKHPYQSAVSFL